MNLIDETVKEQHLELKNIDLRVNDELDFKLYHNWLLNKSTIVLPKYLTFKSLDDLKSSYINKLIKKEYGLEVKEKEQWLSEDGKKLISSFLLNDQAKKFLISKSIYKANGDETLQYFSILIGAIYVIGQLIKSHYDILLAIAAPKTRALTLNRSLDYESKQKMNKPGKFSLFYSRFRYSILSFFVLFWALFSISLYFAIGIRTSRDSDAKSLSKGLADAVIIKSKSALIDFNYYSGGEEAYNKLVERNQSLNNLFYKDCSSFVRLAKGMPFTKDGDELTIFSNHVSTLTSYNNINSWEQNS